MTPKELIIKIRNHVGLSQREFASAVPINKSTLSLYECGKRNPRPDKMRLLVDYARQHGMEISYSDFKEK